MEDELYAIADRLVARAQPGEQVEVVVSHSKDTEVRVYEGEIESMSVAESQGVGVRVVADSRQGFASAGTFDPTALDDLLAGLGPGDEAVGDGVELVLHQRPSFIGGTTSRFPSAIASIAV